MTETDTYVPTPEFRDYLEVEVVRAFRRERRRGLLRTVALLFASIALGTSAGIATAQVRDSARRDSLLAAANAELAIVAVRLDLARATAADARAKANVGAATLTSSGMADANLRAAEAQALRAKLNVEEIRLSAQAPRDELNAPLVGTRDFVAERIQADLFAAQQRLAAAEAARDEVERRVRVGAAGEIERLSAAVEVARARGAFGTLAERQVLRREFRTKGTAPEQLVRRLRVAELRFELLAAQEGVKLAAEQLALIRKRLPVGAADQIELLRAELQLRELQREAQLMVDQLRQMKGA
jgi:hypothetical protein